MSCVVSPASQRRYTFRRDPAHRIGGLARDGEGLIACLHPPADPKTAFIEAAVASAALALILSLIRTVLLDSRFSGTQ